MAKVTVRYLVIKKTASGALHYWQPSKELRADGYKPVRLSNNLKEAIIEAERINADLDKSRQRGALEPANTMDKLIQDYYGSRAFLDLRPKTQYEYRRHIERSPTKELLEKRPQTEADQAAIRLSSGIRPLFGAFPLEAISRRVLHRWYQEREASAPAEAAAAMRVMRILMQRAVDAGLISVNPATKPKIHVSPLRATIWTDAQVAAFVAAADARGMADVGTAVLLGYEIGQRQGDILTMRKAAVVRTAAGLTAIKLRQSKTGAWVEVPLSAELIARLDQALRQSGDVAPLLADRNGKPWRQKPFHDAFRLIKAAAGVPDDLWYLDLRRSCVVRLAEAGCSIAEITAITGHDVDQATAILERYMPRSSAMAASAVEKRAAAKKKMQER